MMELEDHFKVELEDEWMEEVLDMAVVDPDSEGGVHVGGEAWAKKINQPCLSILGIENYTYFITFQTPKTWLSGKTSMFVIFYGSTPSVLIPVSCCFRTLPWYPTRWCPIVR